MRIRFILGPSGSGKTFRCLEEIRAALRADPSGPPLLLLAPKQATFQLERQLLADPSLSGYTRLQILAFDRLAHFIFRQLHQAPPSLLSEEGRLMVLQALLTGYRQELKTFHRSANAPGFALELSSLWGEFYRYDLSNADLAALAAKAGGRGSLERKLHDLLLLRDGYHQWLNENGLSDPDALLGLAAAKLSDLEKSGLPQWPEKVAFQIDGLWLDGFAQMTPQEIDLLGRLLPFCRNAVLAFNLAGDVPARPSWLSIWSLTARTYGRIQERVNCIPGCQISTECLPRGGKESRYKQNPVIAFLESAWDNPARAQDGKRGAERRGRTAGTNRARGQLLTGELFKEFEPLVPPDPAGVLQVFPCPDREAEAVVAAREIGRFVRAGGRYRETTVLVRDLDPYHAVLRRVFARYTIPFFLDRRESITHHPFVQLTRCALRCVAFGWEHEDWFGALKTGLVPGNEEEIDALENDALACGWQGLVWWDEPSKSLHPAWVRAQAVLGASVLEAFQEFRDSLSANGINPSGRAMATGLLRLWKQLKIEKTLEGWIEAGEIHHSTVWEQMNAWVSNVDLAFAARTPSWSEWMVLVETGLGHLTIGLIPPSLDQVVIGSVDRSRTGEVKLAVLLGFNELVFPAPPSSPALLTIRERSQLADQNVFLGPGLREQLGFERYYGYIACTRAREKIVITYAAQDAENRPLNPSPFIPHLETIFPQLRSEPAADADLWWEAEHPVELIGPILKNRQGEIGRRDPDLESLESLFPLAEMDFTRLGLPRFTQPEPLAPGLAEQLYGPALATSISALEKFSACPFQFFVQSGLRTNERTFFEVDPRQEGIFQHEVLARFHKQLQAEQRKWRDVTPAEARKIVAVISAETARKISDGRFDVSVESRFRVRALTRALENFVATAVAWSGQNEFEPWEAELSFGLADSRLPGWEIDLGAGHKLVLRGKIDRVDILRNHGTDEVLCLVLDYKARGAKLDQVLVHHGIRLQLPVYLGVLRYSQVALHALEAGKIIPAGLFYVNLQGEFRPAKHRRELQHDQGSGPQTAYQHQGWFNSEFWRKLDTRDHVVRGTQFRFRVKKDGSLSSDGLPPAEFYGHLTQAEDRLVRIGRQIYSGRIQVDPYQKGGERACQNCEYGSICRIDSWEHRFRQLS